MRRALLLPPSEAGPRTSASAGRQTFFLFVLPAGTFSQSPSESIRIVNQLSGRQSSICQCPPTRMTIARYRQDLHAGLVWTLKLDVTTLLFPRNPPSELSRRSCSHVPASSRPASLNIRSLHNLQIIIILVRNSLHFIGYSTSFCLFLVCFLSEFL